MKKLTLLSLAFFATSCISTGKNFPSNTSWVKIGETKQTDVKMVLGEPFSVGNSAGESTWTYGFYSYSLFDVTKTKELKFYWDESNIVRHFAFTSSFPEDKNNTPTTTPKKVEDIKKPVHY